MNFIIRPAREGDQRAIRALVRKAKLYPFDLKWRRFTVAVSNEMVVGVAQVKRHRDGTKELASVAVAPDFQELGMATALIQKILAEQKGWLFLYCRDELEGFYNKFGFFNPDPAVLPTTMGRMLKLANFFNKIVSLFVEPRSRLLVMGRAAHNYQLPDQSIQPQK